MSSKLRLFALFTLLTAFALYAQVFSSERTYRAAITAFKEKNYYSARLLFQEILHKDPTGEYGDDAQYYSALTYFYEGEYKTLIFEMRLLLRDYPVSPFIPRAYFYTGEAYFYLKDYKTALESHHAFIRRYPEHILAPDALYTTGFIFMDQKRYEEAISEFKRILETYPDSKPAPNAALQAGIASYNLKDYTGARRAFNNVMMKFPTAEIIDQAGFWVGKSYYAEGKLSEAEHEFQKVFEGHPDSASAPEALYLYALCRHQQNDLKSAQEKLNLILTQYPNYKSSDAVHFRLAQIAASQNENDLALKHLGIILKNYTQQEFYLPAIELTGDILRKTGQTEKALALYEQARQDTSLRSEVRDGITRKKADILYLDKNFGEAATLYKSLADKNPTSTQAPEELFMAAQAHFKGALFKKADGLADELIKKYSDARWRGNAYYLKAEIAFALNDFDGALQYYRRILRFYPDHERTFDSKLGVGWSYFELKQYARASDEFQKLLPEAKKPADQNRVRLAWAACQFNLRDFNGAVLNYQKVLSNSNELPDDGEEAQFQIAWVRYRQLEFRKSLEAFSQYLSNYPKGKRVTEAKYFAAWSHNRLGEFKQAEQLFQAITKELEPSPFQERAMADLGKTQLTQKEYSQAQQTFEAFLLKFPQSGLIEEVYYSLGLTFARSGNPDQLQASIEKLRIVNPNSAYISELSRELGEYYRKQGDLTRAEAIFAQIAQQSPVLTERLEARFLQSNLFIEKKETDRAIETLRGILKFQELEAEPYRIRAFMQIVQIYYDSKQYNEGLAFIATNRGELPKTKSALSDLALREAEMLILTNQNTQARKLLQPLLDDRDYSIDARYFMGLSFYQDKMLTQAFDYFKQASVRSDHPLMGKALFYQAEIYFEKGEYDLAAREYARVTYLFSADNSFYEKTLFKAALSFQKAGKSKESESYKEKLRQAFPKSMYLKEL